MIQRINQLEHQQRDAGETPGANWAQTLEQAKLSLARSIADEMASSSDDEPPPSAATATRPAPVIRGTSVPSASGRKLYHGGSRGGGALPASNAGA
jgi:hypothetical protein